MSALHNALTQYVAAAFDMPPPYPLSPWHSRCVWFEKCKVYSTWAQVIVRLWQPLNEQHGHV